MGKSLKGKNLEKVYPGTMYFISPGLLIGLAKERLFIWLIICINNCRNSSKESYATHYKRIKKRFIVKECIGVIIKTFKRKNAGFKYITLYTFRHILATRAIENGMQPKTL